MTPSTPAATRGSSAPSRSRARPRSGSASRFALLLRTAAGVLLLLLAATAQALAADPLPHLAGPVTDQAGVLSPADETEITAAIDQLRADHDVQLFVAFVGTTGSATVTAYTQSVAEQSSLGGNDALLLVAVDDRSDALWVGPSLGSVSTAEIDSILTDAVEPLLANGDFAGAMVAGAQALGDAVAGEPVPVATAPLVTPATGGTSSSGGGTSVTGSGGGSGAGPASRGINVSQIFAVLLILGGILLAARAVWNRRAASKARAARLDTLNRDANRALLATDEALKDASNDVEFASAQWGDQEVVPYRDAIRQAGDDLRAAFSIRQRLDDADPETPAERDELLREIIGRTARAQGLLDAQEQRFDQLRDLQQAAPAQLAALPAAIEALRARRDAADATATRLRAAYAPSATASLAGNLEEAAKALDAAAAEAARGSGVVGARPADGVVALRRAQDGVARSTQLIEAVERLAASLDDAAARLAGELDAAATDVEAARDATARLAHVPPAAQGEPAAQGAPAAGAVTDPAGALAAAEAALADARRAAEASPLDPLAALQRAVAANQAADAIVASVRAAEVQWSRRLQVAGTAVATARAHVTRAADFITTRRHGVGQPARTRAAEAQLRLDEAATMAASEPEQATASANRATQLADEAYRLAAGEFDQWNQGTGPVAGPYHAGSLPESQVVGAVLGGIIGAVLSGAASGRGSRGSGWGGSPWGGPFGGSGGGSGGGGFGFPSGPFGGGGRVGGGGFSMPSGGGGRVRGGRW